MTLRATKGLTQRKLHHRDWLDSHINFEVTAGKIEGVSLDRAREQAALLGNPQTKYPSIHITGTNGKGSTAHIITHLLVAQGYKVGTYASPHTVFLNERFQINGMPVDDDELDSILADLKELEEKNKDISFTWFEIGTMAAFCLFERQNIDVAVVEVGKLGRFDATNIIDADVCVVTNVARDHTDGKGEWEKHIAWEKAGIIKSGAKLVSGVTRPDLRAIFEEENPSQTYYLGSELKCIRNEKVSGVANGTYEKSGRCLDIQTNIDEPRDFKNLFLALHGSYQGNNATLALGAVQAFTRNPLTQEIVAEAFSRVRLSGRFEILCENPLTIIDGGHNPDGAQAARNALEDYLADSPMEKSTLIFGITGDKSPEEMLKALKADTFDSVICTTLPTPRTREAKELHEVAIQMGLNSVCIDEPIEAYQEAVNQDAMNSDLIFVCGSLYLAGAIKEVQQELKLQYSNI